MIVKFSTFKGKRLLHFAFIDRFANICTRVFVFVMNPVKTREPQQNKFNKTIIDE
jgi:hypothetical protein